MGVTCGHCLDARVFCRGSAKSTESQVTLTPSLSIDAICTLQSRRLWTAMSLTRNGFSVPASQVQLILLLSALPRPPAFPGWGGLLGWNSKGADVNLLPMINVK
jgi:hypothetical protein